MMLANCYLYFSSCLNFSIPRLELLRFPILRFSHLLIALMSCCLKASQTPHVHHPGKQLFISCVSKAYLKILHLLYPLLPSFLLLPQLLYGSRRDLIYYFSLLPYSKLLPCYVIGRRRAANSGTQGRNPSIQRMPRCPRENSEILSHRGSDWLLLTYPLSYDSNARKISVLLCSETSQPVFGQPVLVCV